MIVSALTALSPTLRRTSAAAPGNALLEPPGGKRPPCGEQRKQRKDTRQCAPGEKTADMKTGQQADQRNPARRPRQKTAIQLLRRGGDLRTAV